MTDPNMQRLYERIKSIADQLVARDDHFSRADLAYELRSEGVTGDSSAVSRLVWEAYKAMGDDPNIRDAFLNNSSHKSLVDEYRVIALIEANDSERAVDVVTEMLAESKRSIDRVLLQVDEASRDYVPGSKPSLSQQAVDTVVGTAGIKAIQAESADILDCYAALVDGYKEAKGDIKGAITSFGELREHVLYDYREWVALLKDLFGDRILSVAPEVFDFDTLRWLDVDSMYGQAKLSFDTLAGRSSELLNSISESFRASLSETVRDYSYSSNRRAGLVMAAVNLVSHYSKTATDTARLRSQLLDLRSDVARDATGIQADMARLVEIYRTINDIYLAQADLFYRYGDKVFSREWQELREALYSTPELKSVLAEREGIHKHLKELEEKMLDAKLNITFYKDQVATTEELLTSLKEPYEAALKAKPSEPNWLKQTVSFGKAREKYNRDLTEWSEGDGVLVKKYEELQVDLRIFGEEIESLRRVYDESLKEYHKSRMDAGDLTKHIHELQTLSPELLARAAEHLSPVLKLLAIAREIIESRLEGRLVTPVTLPELEQRALPTEVTERIERLRKQISGIAREAQQVVPERVRTSVSTPVTTSPTAPATVGPLSGDDPRARQLAQVAAARSRVAAQRSAAALDELLLLRKKEVENKLTEDHYRRELDRIRETFQYNMRQIDDKSAFITEVRRRVHTDLSDQSVRDDLLLLAGEGPQDLTAEDIRDLLDGKTTLSV